MYAVIRSLVNGIDQGAHCLSTSAEFHELTPEDLKQSAIWIGNYQFPQALPQSLRDAILGDARALLRSEFSEAHAALILDLLFAYHTASDEVKASRQKVVAAEFEKYLGHRWQDVVGQTEGRSAYRMASMNIVADPFLPDYVGAVAKAEFARIVDLEPVGDQSLQTKVLEQKNLWLACVTLGEFPRKLGGVICFLHKTRPLAESRMLVDALSQIVDKLDTPSFDLFEAAYSEFTKEDEFGEGDLHSVRFADAAVKLLRSWLDDTLDAMDGLTYLAAVRGETNRRMHESAAITLAAVAGGRNLGAIGQAAIECMKLISEIEQARDAQMLNTLQTKDSERLIEAKARLQAKLAARKRGGTPPTTTKSPGTPVDADGSPVYTWSLEKLMEWIDGASPSALKAALQKPKAPVATKPAPKPPTKGGAKPKPQPSKPANTTAVKSPAEVPADKEPSTVDLGSKKTEIQLVVQNGLREYAKFTLLDVREMSRRAEALGLARDAKNLAVLGDELQGMLDSEAIDPSKAADCFESAEKTTRTVRLAAKKAADAQRFLVVFARAVTEALRKEDLCFDKRTGGVIRPCGFRSEYWGTVSAEFHGRCLHICKVRTQAGEATQLRENEALAFYVTGSSLSGYVFDISVHLWRRRRGSVAAPAGTSGFMNEEHWYDTRIPYCVLHVGQSK